MLNKIKDRVFKLNEKFDFEKVEISISVGGIYYRENRNFSSNDLIKKADENLYEAKKTKNSVITSFLGKDN